MADFGGQKYRFFQNSSNSPKACSWGFSNPKNSFLSTKMAISNFLMPEIENFSEKCPQKHILGHIGRFWKNRYFCPPKSAKMGHHSQNGKYEQKTKNRPKICVFRFCRLKLGSNDAKWIFISDPAYKKLISPKTKKLAQIF